MVGECPGTSGDDAERVHFEVHPYCFGEVLLAFFCEDCFLAGVHAGEGAAAESGSAEDGDDEGGVQSHGVILKFVLHGFTALFQADLGLDLVADIFYFLRVGDDLGVIWGDVGIVVDGC